MNISLFVDLHGWLAGAAICFARLAPIFFMLPFLNSRALTGAPRNAVIVLVGMALWPYTADTLPRLDALGFYGLLLREAGVGVILGALLSWPFWVLHGMGNLIDNQRGAMLSSTVDPANGDDTSELANFLQMFAAVIYLEAGGMGLVVETLGRSYQLCSPLHGCQLSVQPLLGLLDPLISKTLIISAPVVATLLLSEALLGLLARFAPQMNAFSMSLTVKGAIALLVLLLYFGAHLPSEVQRMGRDKPAQLVDWFIRRRRTEMSSASKTEKPTPKKRRDAAKKGQTFKAKDLSTSCLMLCGLVYLAGNGLLLQVMEVFRRIIAAGFAADPQRYAAELGVLMLKIILPLIVVCFLASAVPTLLTTGMAIASEALKINFGALNPINGFKKLFSLRTVKDTVKSLLYLGCFVIAFWVVWVTQRHLLFAQLYATPLDLFPIWAHLLLMLLLTFLGCILLILILDALCEYWLYIKDLKMDKQAVKREHKDQDGNPEIKGRRRDLHRELLSEQIKSDIRGSRVIVANPTHIAVGIYFQPEVTIMPFISLLETNQRALAVRKYAAEVGVPVITDVALARRIFKTHQRYTFIQLQEIENVLRLLVWLEQVEQA